jgi:hypothetical protein
MLLILLDHQVPKKHGQEYCIEAEYRGYYMKSVIKGKKTHGEKFRRKFRVWNSSN